MPSGVSKHIQRLSVVVSAVVQQGGPEFFGALPLALQLLDTGHAEVVMHLFRDVVRGPGRSRQGRDLLESDHAMSCRIEQDQPVRLIVAAVGGDLVARAVPETDAAEAALVPAVRVVAASALGGLVGWLRAGGPVGPGWGVGVVDSGAGLAALASEGASRSSSGDLADVVGQSVARRAAEICAAGGHHLLLLGPLGVGNSMLGG